MAREKRRTGNVQNVTVRLDPETVELLDALADRDYQGYRARAVEAIVERWKTDELRRLLLQEARSGRTTPLLQHNKERMTDGL